MDELQFHLAQTISKPSTVPLARQLLGIAVTILAEKERDPECVMADEPVLDLVRNAMSALQWLPDEMTPGPAKRDKLN